MGNNFLTAWLLCYVKPLQKPTYSNCQTIVWKQKQMNKVGESLEAWSWFPKRTLNRQCGITLDSPQTMKEDQPIIAFQSVECVSRMYQQNLATPATWWSTCICIITTSFLIFLVPEQLHLLPIHHVRVNLMMTSNPHFNIVLSRQENIVPLQKSTKNCPWQ